MGLATGKVQAVSRSKVHTFSKTNEESIRLLAGLGVEGDAHLGVTVKHRSRVAQDPNQPNLRQVHLIHGELHDELRAAGFSVAAGQMGENITTRGLELLRLPAGTRQLAALPAVIAARRHCPDPVAIHAASLQCVVSIIKSLYILRFYNTLGVIRCHCPAPSIPVRSSSAANGSI